MWSRPAMLGSIRKRASVWRGPVRSSSLSFVSSRGPTAALHPLGKNCRSDCAAGATRLLRSCPKKFLAQIHFLKFGRRRLAGRSEDCRRWRHCLNLRLTSRHNNLSLKVYECSLGNSSRLWILPSSFFFSDPSSPVLTALPDVAGIVMVFSRIVFAQLLLIRIFIVRHGTLL
jgi:hypothetical protein